MKLLNIVLALVALCCAVTASADSRYLDSQRLSDCGGTVELREAANGDLSIKFENLNTSRCNQLRFFDVTSGRTLKTYVISGTSYSLSQSQKASLSSDCRVGFTVSGAFRSDTFNITLGWWCQVVSHPVKTNSVYSYQLSSKNNCKVMLNGTYTNKNAGDSFCAGARSKDDVVTYEWSNSNNCKRMVNRQYSGHNVDDSYCTVRF